MKSLDFSHPGQMPGSQDRLNFLQEGWTECLVALAQMNGQNGPFVISGCAITRTSAGGSLFNWSIAAGWMYYNGELLKILASGPIVIDESVNAAYIQITQTSLPLTYNSGSTYNVINDDSGALSSQAIGTATTSLLFPLSGVPAQGAGQAVANIGNLYGGWIAPTYAGTYTADGTSPIGYRQKTGSKEVRIQGVTNNSVGSSLITASTVFTLPVGMRPGAPQTFVCALPGSGYAGSSICCVTVLPNGTVQLRGDISAMSNIGVYMEISFEVD